MRVVISAICALGLMACATSARADRFVTLGTLGGPLPQANRSQPANAIVRDNGSIVLVDAGDGAAEQLAQAQLSIARVDTIFLSHMHFDHTAGVLGVLALRFQLQIPGVVTVYGPPGTADFVAGLVDSMTPFAKAGFGVPGERAGDPQAGIKVVEIGDGSTVTLGEMKVTAAQNTHYTFQPGSELDRRYKSLSYRFDMKDRSIVYTGDTGPSEKVERLAKGADILVSEVIDVDKIVSIMRATRPDVSAQDMEHLIQHQQTQHLTYAEVAGMAQRAGVKSVVLTHIVPGSPTPTDELAYRVLMQKTFSGPVVFARDLDSF